MQPAQQLCPAALDTTSSSKAAVPLSQAAERPTVRTQLALLSSFAYDAYMCNAHCCCLYCVVELNDTPFFPTSTSIPRYTEYIISFYYAPGTRYHILVQKNRSYEYHHLRIMHQVSHTRTINQTRHQVPGITRRAFKSSFLIGSIHHHKGTTHHIIS